MSENGKEFASQTCTASTTSWQCFSAYLNLNPMDENEEKDLEKETVLYTRRYQFKLRERMMITRTATIIRENRDDKNVPNLHLLTVDLLRKDQIDEESRNAWAPDFKCVVFHDIYKTSFYVRFMKATQPFKMQNFPHLLKNHLGNDQAYFFGNLKAIENPREMRANFMMLSLADDCTMVEVLISN